MTLFLTTDIYYMKYTYYDKWHYFLQNRLSVWMLGSSNQPTNQPTPPPQMVALNNHLSFHSSYLMQIFFLVHQSITIKLAYLMSSWRSKANLQIIKSSKSMNVMTTVFHNLQLLKIHVFVYKTVSTFKIVLYWCHRNKMYIYMGKMYKT